MQKFVYTVYDSKAEVYGMPVYHEARGEALRAFSDAINGEAGLLSMHPEDFTLFEIGRYNQKTGLITSLDRFSVANGVDVLIPKGDV